MATPHGYATFPGVNQILSCTYTMTTGVQPGVAIIEMAPQNNYPASGGPLKFFYGNTVITIPDCKIDKASISINERGQIVSLAIFDWRWRWVFPTISLWANHAKHETGDTNLLFPPTNAEIDVQRVRDARRLAELCLAQMRQTAYDVGVLPKNAYPAVNWDYENAALALQSVADQFGCIVVPTLNGSVKIAKKGVGIALPDGPVLDGGISIDPQEVPSKIAIVCGKTLFELMLPLRAVGLDTDGVIKPIDSLSYRPDGGWSPVDPLDFGSIPGSKVPNQESGDRNSPRDLAIKSVWKWYQVYVPAGGIRFAFSQIINDVAQILPINSHRISTATQQKESRRDEATIFGTFAARDGTTNNNPRMEYKHPFSIDEGHGLVVFDRPVFRYNRNAGAKFARIEPANMHLLTSCEVRIPPTWSYLRWVHTVDVPGGDPSIGTRYVVKDDLVYEHRGIWNSNGILVGRKNNLSTLQPQIDYYAKAEVDSYQVPSSESRTYIGLLPIQLDGAINQVTWSISDRGTITQASRNSEHSTTIPPYAVRKRWDDIRRLADGVVKRRV